MRPSLRARGVALAALFAAAALACSPAGDETAGAAVPGASPPAASSARAGASPGGGLLLLDPPAAPGAMAPNLAADGADLLMTWLEPLPAPVAGEEAHALRFARLSAGRWSQPVTIVSGAGLVANWADFPAVAAGPQGLVAHWLEKIGEDTYAYGIYLARSTDRGATWRPLGLLHDDRSPTEHGFVSFLAEPAALRAVWLDGRAMAGGGPMGLRTARIGGGAPGASEVLDARVCDCCQTDAAMAAAGPVVAYRDRTEEEIRDISVVRWTGGGWSAPAVVHVDGWRIPGCPVNGPAIAAAGNRVAVAWFTAAPLAAASAAPGKAPAAAPAASASPPLEGAPRVRLAFSPDGGASFGAPIEIDGGKPLGRVDVALTPSGEAVVSWLAIDAARPGGAGAVVRLRRVSPRGAGAPFSVAATGATRSSGFPRLALQGEDLVLAWVEEGKPGRLRAATLPLLALPPPPGGASSR